MRRLLALPLVLGLLSLLVIGSCEGGTSEEPPDERAPGDDRGPAAPDEDGDLHWDSEGDPDEEERFRIVPRIRPRHGGCIHFDPRRPPPGDDGPVTPYPAGRLHSPITEEVVDHWRRIAARDESKQDDVFAKVGDSHSVGVIFMGCFATQEPGLGNHEHLRPTLDHFTNENADGTSSFERDSVATVAGIGSRGIVRGSPSLLRQETDAIEPRFATVMVGTNDARVRSLEDYTEDMVDIVDELTREGIIPLLSTIPPLADPDDNEMAIRYNMALRAIASSRSLPLVDLYQALLDLADMGLRSDGVHLSVDWNRGGGMAACIMSDDGFEFGANVRNLLTLEQLDRVRRALLHGEVFDPDVEAEAGNGTLEDPILVEHLPFGWGGHVLGSSLRTAYELPSACSGEGDDLGLVYEMEIEEYSNLRAALVVRGGRGRVEIRAAGRNTCLALGDGEASVHVPPGRYNVVLRIEPGTGDRIEEAECLLSISAESSAD